MGRLPGLGSRRRARRPRDRSRNRRRSGILDGVSVCEWRGIFSRSTLPCSGGARYRGDLLQLWICLVHPGLRPRRACVRSCEPAAGSLILLVSCCTHIQAPRRDKDGIPTARPPKSACPASPLTTSGARQRSCAARREESWSKFKCCSVTPQCRRRSDTSALSRILFMHRMTPLD